MKLVRKRLRERVYDDDPGDDKGKAKERRPVERLLEPKPSDQGDQHNAKARPNGVGDANRDGSQAEREEEEADRIGDSGHETRNETGKGVGGLQSPGSDHLEYDRGGEVEIGR